MLQLILGPPASGGAVLGVKKGCIKLQNRGSSNYRTGVNPEKNNSTCAMACALPVQYNRQVDEGSGGSARFADIEDSGRPPRRPRWRAYGPNPMSTRQAYGRNPRSTRQAAPAHHDSLRLFDSSRAAPPTRNSVFVMSMPLFVPGYLPVKAHAHTRAHMHSL
jgi:hypothetical protein